MSASLVDLLSRESDLVRTFIEILTTEQEALRRGEIDALPTLSAEKSKLVEQLNTAEAERGAVLQRSGHGGDRKGMEAWLASNPKNVVLVERWNNLLTLAAEAKRLNDLNGRLIALRLETTSQALDVLAHQPRRSGLYGRDGLTASKTGSRIIDAA